VRIALVAHGFEPAIGGAARYGWTVARGLVERGHSVRVLCCARRSPGAEDAGRRHPGLQIERLPCPHRWAAARVEGYALAVRRRLRGIHADAVFSICSAATGDVLRVGWLPYVATLRDLESTARTGVARAWHRFRAKTLVQLRRDRALLRDGSTKVVFNAKAVLDLCLREFGLSTGRAVLLRNGVDSIAFHPESRVARRDTARRDLGLPRAATVFLLLGPAFGQKGLRGAIGALSEVGHAGGGPYLLAVGRDPGGRYGRLAAREGVAERVRIVPPLEDVGLAYAASDAVLLPTRPEPFSNACLEAMAGGLPVVVSRGNGASEIVTARIGRLVDGPEDRAGLAEALRALEDPATRSALGAEARRAAECFTWESHVSALEAILASARS
jgi:UDP-glucose:(heptosyl)LPS alpha-1,3-glucosyltransferase